MPDAYSELAAGISAARERFLAVGEAVAGTVREQILNSWRRSRFSSVDVDRIEPPYSADIDFDHRLARSAGPVFDRLERELTDEPMTVVLTDPEAYVLDRRCGDRALQRKLDKVSLAPGFSYAEEYVGTNGIGTALEDQSSAWVFGPEHFSERLQALSCAGAVIRNPLRGRVEGVIDLTCWRGEASPLMRVLVQEAARDVSQRLVELLRSPSDTTADLRLPSGRTVRLQSRQVASRAGVAGALIEVQTLGRVPRRRLGPMPRYLPLAGVAGRSSAWLHACEEAITACERHARLLLVGEAGAGKLALGTAVHRRWFPSERLHVIEGPGTADPGAWIADLRQELEQTTGTIVLRRLDQLDAAVAELLAATLGDLDATAGWLVATSASHDLPPPLLEHFPMQVGVPPLRYRVEDLHELVPFLLDRLAPGSDARCSPEALQVLLHNQWLGNVEQLSRVLGVALGRCRGRRIESADLPAECHTVTRQVLTRWQWIERDAIVEALVEAKGNRTQAAAKLGMSRATIYRRINAFGIQLAGLHD